MDRQCETHGVVKHYARKEGGWRCSKCSTQAVTNRRRAVKRILVEEFGGECKICGYDRYIGALDFHHIDPNNKEFGLSKSGFTRSLDLMRVEAQKCILICSNCHRELEAGLIDIEQHIPR